MSSTEVKEPQSNEYVICYVNQTDSEQVLNSVKEEPNGKSYATLTNLPHLDLSEDVLKELVNDLSTLPNDAQALAGQQDLVGFPPPSVDGTKNQRNAKRKGKKYEEPMSSDEEENQRRLRAKQAKMHRDNKKMEMDNFKRTIDEKEELIRNMQRELEAKDNTITLLEFRLQQTESSLESVHQLVKNYGNICQKQH